MKWLLFLNFALITISLCSCLHLQGTWHTSQFFKFLVKFGFQKTDINDKVNTFGYIFGNITSRYNRSHQALLVVVDRDYFLDFYRNRSVLHDLSKRCEIMFSKIQRTAFDKDCNTNGTLDFLRNIPCHINELCEDEEDPKRIVPGHQFTYAVQDTIQARFWYVSLVACSQDPTSCRWRASQLEDIDYDIWLVNGNPYNPSQNIFTYQFSFDMQDTLKVYLTFFALYVILFPVQFYAAVLQLHRLTRLFTVSLLLRLLYFLCFLIHGLTFSMDGVGMEVLLLLGDILYILSESLLMLLLLLVAKGWAISRTEIGWAPMLAVLWLLYTCLQVLLYIWNMTEVDVIEDLDEYQTIPGWLALVLRLVIMAWFIVELRNTVRAENEPAKLRFYVHFGAGILVWFVYLPVAALIALTVSSLWRPRLLLGVTSTADFLAFSILTHLFWPTRSGQYLQLASTVDPSEELEEFSEAPHNVQHRSYHKV